MHYLLDTHIILWYIDSEAILSDEVLAILYDTSNTIYISTVTFYEVAIKINTGKLKITGGILGLYKKTVEIGFNTLEIKPEHLNTFSSLPQIPNHKDPFDRLIIATAISEQLTLVSIDRKFEHYKEYVNIIG